MARRTMYELLHPTQSFIPSCIMFPPNAPHVGIKLGLLAILPNFKGLENENPYVHVRAFEEVIGSCFAQNVIELSWNRSSTTTSGGSVFRLREEDNMSAKINLLTKKIEALKLKRSRGVNAVYREEPMEECRICQEIDHTTSACKPLSQFLNVPEEQVCAFNQYRPNNSSYSNNYNPNMRNHPYLSYKSDNVLNPTGPRNFYTSHTTSSSSRPPLEDVLYTFIQKQGEQNQRFESMFTRIDEEMRETKSQVARLTEVLSKIGRGKLPSQTRPNPNNQSLKVVSTDKFKEVKFVTILRSSNEIGKGAPKANEKSKETPVETDESGIAKSNDIEKCPFLAPFPQSLKLPMNLDVTSEILEHLHQVKVNLPLLHIIKQMPLYAKLADRSVKKPRGVVEDVLVKVDNFYYPIDFFILDIDPTLHPRANIPIILGRSFLATTNALINCRNGRMKITFGSMTMELNICNVNPQQLVDEECEYVNLIEATPQEDFNKNCFADSFKTPLVHSIASNELTLDVKISDFTSLLDSSQILEEKQVVVVEKPPRSKKKSLHAYSDAPKLELKQPPKDLPCASIKPHAISTVEVPSKMSVDQEIEKKDEKTKFFERHIMKRKALQDTRLSKKLLNNSKGVALHVARLKSAKGRNYSFGGSRSGGRIDFSVSTL
uniref:Aspartic peptidase DDI1-type domain-containing protein n=1 Tax=Fagus sylvatica TaxID=28930 RepID=A0A2N9G969_FAGSY